MFKVGDFIMYGAKGACRIKDITELDWDVAEKGRKYYVIEPVFKGDLFYVPVGNDKVYIRPVMSKEEVLSLIDSMPEVKTEKQKVRSLQQLARLYQTAIDSHEAADLVKLTKSIHMKEKTAQGQNKKLGQLDISYLEHAENLLFGEIAVVLDIPRESVVSFITEHLERKTKDIENGK